MNTTLHLIFVRSSLLALCSLASLACAKTASTPLRFQTYLNAVENHSLNLAAQREMVTIAEAGIGIAGLRPDPELSYETSREKVRANHPRPLTWEPSLSWVVETGGKRKARIQLARSQVALTEANLQGFKHQLHNEAASAFAEACRTHKALARKEQTLLALSEIVRANEVRHQAGDIGRVELLQSRVERDQFQSEVTQARAEAAAAELALAVPLGRDLEDLFDIATLDCDFVPFLQGNDVQALIPQALQARDDIIIARAEVEQARHNVALTRANRWVDPTLSVGVATTRGYRESIDGAGDIVDAIPRSRVLTVSVSVPLPFSHMNRGDLVQANAELTQAMLALRQAEHATEIDVRTAQRYFVTARDNVARYRNGVLADTQRVLEGFRLSYRNGASSLLELLDAQRSADDAYLAYLQAESDLAMATVQLQLAIGMRPAL